MESHEPTAPSLVEPDPVSEPETGDVDASAPKTRARARWLLAGGLTPLLVGCAIFAIVSVGSPTRSAGLRSAASSHTLAFTGVGKDIAWLAIIGGVLILIGGALLASLDAPRRILKKLSYLDPRQLRSSNHPVHAKAAGSFSARSALHLFRIPAASDATSIATDDGAGPGPATPSSDGPSSALTRVRAVIKGGTLPALGWPRRRQGQQGAPDDATGPSVAAYRGLAPGWYRDASDLSAARYWDGSALSEMTRPVAPTAASGEGPASKLDAYDGLPPGWYRDDDDPTQARFWDGTRLGEERRAVQPLL